MPDTIQSAETRPLWQRCLIPALLGLCVMAVYLPSAQNEFIYDDHTLIRDQPVPRSLSETFQVFGERHWHDLPYYRPVSRLTMVVQKYLHRDDPANYHRFNAVLMGLTAIMAYALLRLPIWKIPVAVAALTAALFALHPAAASTVYPICSGRETLIPSFFSIAATFAYLKSGRGWRVAALVLMGLALLSKEQAVVLPAVFALADLLQLPDLPEHRGLRFWLIRYLPVIGIVAAYFSVRWYLFGGSDEHSLAVFSAPGKPFASLGYALQTTFLPYAELRYEPKLNVWLSPVRLLSAIFLLGFIIVEARRRWSALRNPILFWLGWILLSLLPTANILKQEASFAERYMFLSMLGTGAIVALLVSVHWQELQFRKIATVIGMALLIYCGTVSFQRSIYFYNDRTFLTQWIETDPQLVQPRMSLAEHLLEEADFRTAVPQLQEALQLAPESPYLHGMLGEALLAVGESGAAEFHCQRSIDLDPENADLRHNFGVVLAVQGKTERAAELFQETIRLNPAHVLAHFNLANMQARLDRHREASSSYREAIRLRPDYVPAYLGLGDSLLADGRKNEAREALQKALEFDPASAEAAAKLRAID